MMLRILNVIVALWLGSLVTICFIVAPSLFRVLPDSHVAGNAAGFFFEVESWLGLSFGGITLFLISKFPRLASRANFAVIGVAALGPVINEVGLRPYMESARVAGNMQSFGMLHGAGATLFGLACLAALVLFWRISRPAE